MITCDICPDSACCRDVTVEIDEPETLEDWDEIRWMVGHQNVAVYKDGDDDWVVEFKTPCSKLGPNGKCTIYKTRPKKCIDHPVETCVYNGEDDEDEIRFENMEQVDEYVKKHVIPEMKEDLKKQLEALGQFPPSYNPETYTPPPPEEDDDDQE